MRRRRRVRNVTESRDRDRERDRERERKRATTYSTCQVIQVIHHSSFIIPYLIHTHEA